MATNPSLVVQIDGRDNLSGELKKIESSVIRFVGAISSALAAITTIAFPVVSAAAFQKELLAAGKTTEYNREQLALLQTGLQDLSKQSNITAVDFAKIATLGGQLGVGAGGNVESLIAFTEQIGNAVTALDVPVELAVESLGKLINIFNIPPDQYKGLVGALTKVGTASTATSQQLFDVVRRIGNLGGSVDLPAAAALSGAMIDLGLTAETAGTTITKIFADMKTSASEFAAVALRGNVVAGQSMDSLRFTTKEWVELVQTDGIAALKAYVTGLNNLGVTEAARVKATLTGEGRLFEAVTKLQEQERRQSSIADRVAKTKATIRAAESGTLKLTKEQLAIEVDRLKVLENAAEQANVLDRLRKRGAEGFTAGDAGLKAQQTIMAGLSAQYDRFSNNLTALANTVGNVLIPPLTSILRSISDELQTGAAAAQLEVAAQDIVRALSVIGDAFTVLKAAFTEFSGSGIDWGAALRLAVLASGLLLIKGAISLFAVLGRTVVGGVGPLAALSNALFGTVQAANAAAGATRGAGAATTSAGAAAVRTGGLFANMANTIRTSTTAYLNTTASLASRQARLNAVLNQPDRSAQRAASTAAAYSGVAARLRSIPALQAEIINKNGQIAAALVAGNNRSASAYASQQRKLEGILATVRANTIAQDRYNASMLRARSAMAFVNRGVRQAPQQLAASFIPAPVLRAGGFLASARAAATAAGTAFAAAFTGTAGTGVRAGLAGLGAGVAAASRALFVPAGVAAGSGFLAGVGAAFASAAGLLAPWLAAVTNLGRGIVILRGAFVLLGRAVSFAFGFLSRLVGVVFFAYMIKELLQILGLWDKVAGFIERVVEYLGFDADILPDFLRPAASVEKAAQSMAKLEAATAAARAEASKFNAESTVMVTVLGNVASASRELTFNPTDPTAATENATKSLEALSTGRSRARVVAEALARAQDELTRATEANAAAQSAAASGASNGESSVVLLGLAREAANAGNALDGAKARVAELQSSLKTLGGTEADPVAGINTGLKNLVLNLLDAKTAAALFGADTETGISINEAYAATIERRLKATAELARATAVVAANPEANADGGRGRRAQEEADAASEAIKREDEALKTLRKTIASLSRDGGEGLRLFDGLYSSTDINTIREARDEVEKIQELAKSSDFRNVALPTLDIKGIADAASIVVVKTRVRDMYNDAAANAKLMAEKAKTYAEQARGAVIQMAEDVQKRILSMNAARDRAAGRAKNQLEDRKTDGRLRQEQRSIQTRYDTERALMEQTFSRQNALMAEQQAGGVNISAQQQQSYALQQQALFELDERYAAIREKAQDVADIEKAKRGVKDEVTAMDKLIKSTEFYKKSVQEANNIINNPNASDADRVAAVERRSAGLTKLRGLYSELESSAERLANTDPIGGQQLVSPQQIETAQTLLKKVATSIGELDVAGADKISGVYSTLSGNLSGAALGAQQEIDIARASFEQAIAIEATKSGQSIDVVRKAWADATVQSEAFRTSVTQIAALLQNGLLNPGGLDTSKIAAITASMQTAIADAANKGGVVKLSVDQQQLSASLNSALSGVTARPAALVPAAPANVKVTPEPASVQQMGTQVEKGVGTVKLSADLTVRKVVGPDGKTIGYGDLTIGNNARGGPIGTVVSLGEGISRFATGGSVAGPGTGTSDSILSWLSNGEYVMDALTTSRFGSNFFRTLQQAARGGKSARMLQGLSMPRFATGGPVMAPVASPLAGIANDFKSMASDRATSRDSLDVNINQGGRRATIQADREQARNLVDILRTFEKG